jgi:hypothetical protein
MNGEVSKLLILGKVDSYIRSMSSRIRRNKEEREDLISEGRLKVLEVIQKYPDLSVQELVSVCITALGNLYKVVLRTRSLVRNTGTIVDLEEAFYLADKDSLSQMFMDLQLRQLYEIFNGDERKILDCVMDPPEELVNMAREYYEKEFKVEVKLTRSILAEFLGMSKLQLREAIERMRIKAAPILEVTV